MFISLFTINNYLLLLQQQQNSTNNNNNFNNTTSNSNSTCPEFVSSIPSFQKNTWAKCPDTIIMPILSATCLAFYIILVVVCVIGVIKKRESGHLQSRSISGIAVTLTGSFIYVTVTLLRFAIGRARFPCLIFSIVSYTIAPCFAMPSILRCLRLVFQHRFNLIKTNSLLQSSCMIPQQQNTETLFVQAKPQNNNNNTSANVRNGNNTIITSGTLVETFENQVGGSVEMTTREKFILQAHSILTNNTSLIVFWLAIGFHMLMWFVIMVVEDSFFQDEHYFMNGALLISLGKGCGLGFPSTLFVVGTSVCYFIVEFIVIGFCFTVENDTWNIKREVFLLVVTQVLAAGIFTFFSIATIVDFVDYFVPSGFVVVAYSTFEVILTVLIPIISAIYTDSRGTKECDSELEMIISNKETFQILLDYLRKSFCPENLLCYADIEKYKCETTLRQRKKIAHRMVKKYLYIESPLQLNLPADLYSVKNKIMDSISFADNQNALPDDLFADIQLHVLSNLIDAYSRLKFSNKTIQKVSNDWYATKQKRSEARSPLSSIPSSSSLKV